MADNLGSGENSDTASAARIVGHRFASVLKQAETTFLPKRIRLEGGRRPGKGVE
jgi:hypothetical protein